MELSFESKNTHIEYPHKIFEIGEVVKNIQKNLGQDAELAWGFCHGTPSPESHQGAPTGDPIDTHRQAPVQGFI